MEIQADENLPVPKFTELCYNSILDSHNFFLNNANKTNNGDIDYNEYEGLKIRLMLKIKDEYRSAHNSKIMQKKGEDGLAIDNDKNTVNRIEQDIQEITTDIQSVNQIKTKKDEVFAKPNTKPQVKPQEPKSQIEAIIEELPKESQEKLSKIPKKFLNFSKAKESTIATATTTTTEITKYQEVEGQIAPAGTRMGQLIPYETTRLGTIATSKIRKLIKPTWHPPWKLMRVISGHQGWVRCLAVDITNQFFVTGSSDRTIKFWDLASGQLKLTLTGHINTVRGLALSSKHAYLYSCAEDKSVKCWDLEYNKVIRSYHGHLSGVYCLTLHPKLDVIATGGRDAVVRVWDIRTKTQIHVLGGHNHTVSSVISQEFEPQIVSGSHDNMIRLWDIGTGKCMNTLTNHKKSVRSLLFHHEEYTFVSGAPDNIKVWKCPEGEFLRNFSGHNAIINDLALNKDNVLASCDDIGRMYFWDWKSGYNFQRIESKVQPGSISSEASIFCAKFDQSSTRLITGECDKTIKIWKEDENANESTHPIDLDWRFDFEKNRF